MFSTLRVPLALMVAERILRFALGSPTPQEFPSTGAGTPDSA
jgi:hypothetical protein